MPGLPLSCRQEVERQKVIIEQ
jgi:hypothetical protein